MINKIKKILATISIVLLLFLRIAPALAYEIPSAPTPPPSPEASVNLTPPSAPDAPVLEEPAPTPPPTPTLEEARSYEDTQNEESLDESSNNPVTSNSSSPTENSTIGEQTGNQSSDGQVGPTIINTGDATNTAGVSTIANTDLSAGVVGLNSGSASVINSGNGTNSINNGSIGIVDDNSTFQNNSAQVISNLDQTTATGDNSASGNVGDSKITTGDANTSGTVITAVNTNIEGIGIAEFSVVDDQVGDIILDFSAGCIYGCEGNSLTAQNTSNGANSTNGATADTTTNNLTVQTNGALVESNLNLLSDSGGNMADKNTGGSSEITTGDANVAGNALTFANNNLDGGVYFNFVYIYGDLIGDIIMPDEYFASAPCVNCGADILAANTGNGASSTNASSVDQTTNNNTFQYNDVSIENNMLLDATTGNNETNKNTNGDSTIKTGDTDVNAQILNVANSNISGEDWWLVLVNEAGNWIGRILGAPSGTENYAGSDGTQFSVSENGLITAVNSGNGSGSTNSSGVSNTTNNTTVQNNTASILNNLTLSANTGGNSASYNTGGPSKITTGDANIIASIVNMVNNNISGGRLFVTVIDVFGSWTGNFMPPGAKKDLQPLAQNQPALPGQGGTGENQANQDNNQNNNSGSTQNATSSTSNQVAGATQNSNLSGSEDSNFAQVGGVQSENLLKSVKNQLSKAGVRNSKKIKINLAWLLLGLPVPLFGFIKYKRSLSLRDKRSLLPRNG